MQFCVQKTLYSDVPTIIQKGPIIHWLYGNWFYAMSICDLSAGIPWSVLYCRTWLQSLWWAEWRQRHPKFSKPAKVCRIQSKTTIEHLSAHLELRHNGFVKLAIAYVWTNLYFMRGNPLPYGVFDFRYWRIHWPTRHQQSINQAIHPSINQSIDQSITSYADKANKIKFTRLHWSQTDSCNQIYPDQIPTSLFLKKLCTIFLKFEQVFIKIMCLTFNHTRFVLLEMKILQFFRRQAGVDPLVHSVQHFRCGEILSPPARFFLQTYMYM